MGVDAQVDGGGHGLVDQGVIDGEQAPDFLFGQVGACPRRRRFPPRTVDLIVL